MSIKNLFVNARTKILEFKRKHNALVEKVNETPSLIESAIQADKDILSKIVKEYNETDNKTYIVFPKGILPIALNYYSSGKILYTIARPLGAIDVVDNNAEVIGSLSYENQDTNCKIEISGNHISDINFTAMLYLPFEKVSNLKLSSYYLFNPVTSAGTKLYKHTVSITATGYSFSNLTVISDKSESFTRNVLRQFYAEYCSSYITTKYNITLFSRFGVNVGGTMYYFYSSNYGIGHILAFVDNNIGSSNIVLLNNTIVNGVISSQIVQTITDFTITDTVTPL